MTAGAFHHQGVESPKLAAIDLDGTLLGTDHQISPDNSRAVRRLIEAGMEVVLASGRHHLAMQGFARQLPGVRWLVCTQGGELCNVPRTEVLERHFLTRRQVGELIALLKRHAVPALFYARDNILIDSPIDDALDFYRTLSGNGLHAVPTAELAEQSIFKVVAASSEAGINALIASDEVAAFDLQQVRTHKRFYEFMPRGVTKATALQTLTAHLGLGAQNVVAFGDGDNDVPMFNWAGWSVAMSHGWPAAKQHARMVAPAGDPNTALSRAVDCLLTSV